MGTAPDDEYERKYMVPGERVLYREKVVSKTGFRVSVAFAVIFCGLGIAGLLAAAIGGPAGGAAVVGAGLGIGIPFVLFGAMMGVLGVMFSVFRSMVTTSHVHVHFGWSKRRIPLGAIQQARAVTLRGFRQGKVQVGLDGVVRTWVGNSSSGRGVEITYQLEGERKHVITIGSEDADRYVASIGRADAAPARVRVAEEEEEVEVAADAGGARAKR